MKTMISVEEAKELIREKTPLLSARQIKLDKSLGYVLAEDIHAPIDLPPFSQASMDGYGISYEDHLRHFPLQADGMVQAGDAGEHAHTRGTAVRIFTGAKLPDGVDTVVIQELVKDVQGHIELISDHLVKGQHIREKGCELRKGSLALAKNTMLSAAGTAFLAGMGITKVKVFKKPVVSLIITGNELQKPGKPLETGQIYDSNSISLRHALQTAGVPKVIIYYVKDNPQHLRNTIKRATSKSDMVLVSGGISVGDYDFTERAFGTLGVKAVFHKVKQKPGKPLYFGTKGKKTFFGLPGNPASALTCFYEYVYQALYKMQGQDITIPAFRLPLLQPVQKKKNQALFMRASYSERGVVPLEGQESFMMHSYAGANCLIYLPEDIEHIDAWKCVDIHLLPSTSIHGPA